MILIHAADLHLGSPLGGLDQHEQLPAHTIRQAPMRAFERLADLCAERDADVLVIAGDLFDGNADVPTMRAAVGVLERITRAGTRVVTIRGNHDAESRMQRRMPQIDGLWALPNDAPATVRFDDLGIALHGRGFDTPRVNDNIVPQYPDAIEGLCNIGVLHTSLGGAPGHDSYAPCSIDDLIAKSYQYWALGHVHKRAVHCEAPWIIYPGNPQGRDVGETGPRGATVVAYADGAILGTPEHVDLDVVRWAIVDIELESDETADDLELRLGTQLASLVAGAPDVVHVARIVVTGRGLAHDELTADPGGWRERLHSLALEVSPDGRLFLEHVKVRTSPALPPLDDLLAREDFIGDAARDLLTATSEPTPIDADAFATLEKKLAQLQGGAATELLPAIADAELDAAREGLIGRLLVAHAEDAAAGR